MSDQIASMKKKPKTLKKKLRRLSLALLVTPACIFPLFLYLAFSDPKLLVEGWDVYAILFGIPWVLAIAVSLYSNRIAKNDLPE